MKYDVTEQDRITISDIAFRAVRLMEKHSNREISAKEKAASMFDITMDLAATHANGCPLDLERMKDAAPLDLLHDVLGIGKHLDRETGKLQNCFLPRFAKVAEAAE